MYFRHVALVDTRHPASGGGVAHGVDFGTDVLLVGGRLCESSARVRFKGFQPGDIVFQAFPRESERRLDFIIVASS